MINFVPLVYCSLPNKTKKKTYKTVLNKIKNKLNDFEPENVYCDFERAFIGVATQIFTKSNTNGCLFHLSQSMYRHVQACGLQKLYADDTQFNTAIKMIVGLSFVPECDVQFAYDVLLSPDYFVNNKNLLSNLLEYFEKTYRMSEMKNVTESTANRCCLCKCEILTIM